MTDHAIYTLAGEAQNYDDREAFCSDGALSSCFPEDQDMGEAYKMCGIIWDAINKPIAEIRRAMGLTQAQMAERLCVPKRTLENWEYKGTCPVYVRILIARVWMGLE